MLIKLIVMLFNGIDGTKRFFVLSYL